MSEFVRATLIRAARTVAQALVAVIGAAAVLSDVDWVVAASTAGLAGLLSVLNSVITGLPEVPADEAPHS